MIALTVPAAVGLILLGQPLLTLLYQRGAFTAESTAAVYATLRFFALGLVGHSCLELAVRGLFAQQDTVTPLIVAIGSAITNILLAVLLMQSLGAGGLALANSVAITAEVLVLMAILRRRWHGVEGRQILRTLIRVGLASLVMGGVVLVFLSAAQQAGLPTLVVLVAGGLVGVATYIVAGLLFGVREIRRLPAALFGR